MTRRPNLRNFGRRRSRRCFSSARRQAQVLGGFCRWSALACAGAATAAAAGRKEHVWGVPPSPGHTTRPDRGTFKKARFAKDELQAAKRPLTAMQLAGVAPGCDSRRASAPRHGAPTAARGHARRCPCASRPRRHPRRTARPLHARTHRQVASSACKVCSSSTAAAAERPQPQARPRSRRQRIQPGPAHGSARRGTGTGGVR